MKAQITLLYGKKCSNIKRYYIRKKFPHFVSTYKKMNKVHEKG